MTTHEYSPPALLPIPRLRLLWLPAVRLLIGTSLIIALLLICQDTGSTLADAQKAAALDPKNLDSSVSAVQVIQVYAEAAFHALIAAGIALACYIGSRFAA